MALLWLSPLTAALAATILSSRTGIHAFRVTSVRSLASTSSLLSTSSSSRLAMTTTNTNNNANGVGGSETAIKKIGIIGGGAAGLATARAFLRANNNSINNDKSTDNDNQSSVQFEVTVLETRRTIGGIWKYDEDGNDSNANESKKSRPMYRNLRTNLPKELMAFKEYPWGGDGKEASYVTHKQVQQYLESYATKFGLLDHINFGCRVDQLKVLNQQGSDTRSVSSWPQISLQWTDLNTNQSHEQTFDNVCICNGHYALASSPPLHGIKNFAGRVIHAIEYDDPNDFAGQTVLCVGARASGADIAREIGLVAKRVYLSDSTTSEMQEFGNVVLMPRTQSIDENGIVHFSSSSSGDADENVEWTAKDVDVIIFCSGYDYSFPFINEESNLHLKSEPGERRVSPLYEQLWHAEYPSLSFIGLPHSVVPFPCFEIQSTAVVSQLIPSNDGSGVIALPSLSDRLVSAENDANSGGPDAPGRVQDTHFLGSHQWDYCRKLARIAGVYDDAMENYIATNKSIYDKSGKERKGMKPGGEDLYRETRFRRVDAKQSYDILHSELEPVEATL